MKQPSDKMKKYLKKAWKLMNIKYFFMYIFCIFFVSFCFCFYV